MARFDGRRLQASELPLDWDGLRRGDYSDRYFWNGMQILQTLAQEGYRFAGYSSSPNGDGAHAHTRCADR
jgi:nicotinate phosphoribosyltransferase